jgi:hypothetical protein
MLIINKSTFINILKLIIIKLIFKLTKLWSYIINKKSKKNIIIYQRNNLKNKEEKDNTNNGYISNYFLRLLILFLL